jgi:hypothetical protein
VDDTPKKGDPAPNKTWNVENPAMGSVPRNVRGLFQNLTGLASDQDLLNLVYWSNGFNDPDQEVYDALLEWHEHLDDINKA